MMRCVVCDTPADSTASRCTNGCCSSCHATFCALGGATSPGHGLNLKEARARYAALHGGRETEKLKSVGQACIAVHFAAKALMAMSTAGGRGDPQLLAQLERIEEMVHQARVLVGRRATGYAGVPPRAT